MLGNDVLGENKFTALFIGPAYQTVGSHPTSARHPEGHLGLPVLEVDLVLGPHGAPLTAQGGRDPHLISAGDGIWCE